MQMFVSALGSETLCTSMADVQFLPISGLLGSNMKNRVEKSVCSWWNGPCLFEALDAVEVPPRDPKGPLRYFILLILWASSCL